MARAIDIQFQPTDTDAIRLEKLRRLVTAINDLIREASSQGTSSAPTTPETTALNVGSGLGIYRDKTGQQLNLRTLLQGSGIALTLVGDDIVISGIAQEAELDPAVIAGVF